MMNLDIKAKIAIIGAIKQSHEDKEIAEYERAKQVKLVEDNKRAALIALNEIQALLNRRNSRRLR